MTTALEIPVEVEEAAAERIAELGLEAAFRAIVAKAKDHFPGLRKIRAALVDSPTDPGTDLAVALWVHRQDLGATHDLCDLTFSRWKVETYPPEVFIHFPVLTWYEPGDGR